VSFFPNEVERLAIDGLRRFLDNELEPEINQWTKANGDGRIPKAQLSKWIRSLTQFGIVTAPFPEELGGLGLGWSTHLRLVEEAIYSSSTIGMVAASGALFADHLVRNAPDHIVQRYVPGMLKGEIFGSIGVSEPDVGSDVAGAKTKAVLDGDFWVIDGEKTWITNAEYSDFFVCTCRTSENELTHILLDRQEHPYEVRDIQKIAMNGQSTAQVFLSGVRVPVSNTVGKIGDGLKNTLATFERARCHMAAWGYALARRAMDEAIKYSQQRIQHGKPIAGHQLIAAKIATMATEIDAARLMTLRAAAMLDAGQRCDTEAAMAKWYATELAVRATRDALQIHGGNGVTKDFIVERLVREAVIAPIPDGTSEIQKLIIARNLTGIQALR
jgi:acyl-CoA dehydrogenase